jgi:hypothetical protein
LRRQVEQGGEARSDFAYRFLRQALFSELGVQSPMTRIDGSLDGNGLGMPANKWGSGGV